jgi:hypothetical protein
MWFGVTIVTWFGATIATWCSPFAWVEAGQEEVCWADDVSSWEAGLVAAVLAGVLAEGRETVAVETSPAAAAVVYSGCHSSVRVTPQEWVHVGGRAPDLQTAADSPEALAVRRSWTARRECVRSAEERPPERESCGRPPAAEREHGVVAPVAAARVWAKVLHTHAPPEREKGLASVVELCFWWW